MAGENTCAPNMSSDWEMNENNLTNTSTGLIPMGNPTMESCSSTPIVDYLFCPSIWDQPINTQNIQTDIILKGNMFLPPVSNLPTHFASDSGFIERAARFSCFGSGNSFGMMNPFNIADSASPNFRGLGLVQGQNDVFGGNGSKSTAEMQLQRNEMNVTEVSGGGAFKNDMKGENMSGNESGEAEFSGRCVQEESSSKGLGSKKRKRVSEGNENNEGPQAFIEIVKENGGKNVKQGSDPAKEEYIHVRARRGQATNSHSLAERVRREKISERMKYLQDLVPGCSKVTGKAVMLDEIINYVQSLQRQVEFLSMKLATVNPNIEGLLAKKILQHRAGVSSSFPSDMIMPFPTLEVSSQPGLIHANNSTEILQRPITLQPIVGFRGPTSQVPNVWDGELHNIFHMGFNSSAPLTGEGLNGSPAPDHMKAEP